MLFPRRTPRSHSQKHPRSEAPVDEIATHSGIPFWEGLDRELRSHRAGPRLLLWLEHKVGFPTSDSTLASSQSRSLPWQYT
jgi:hypothetical protein